MRRVLRSRLRRRALVTLKSGDAFLGVMWEWDREAFVLRNVSHVAERSEPVPVDGEVVLLASEVAFIQLP